MKNCILIIGCALVFFVMGCAKEEMEDLSPPVTPEEQKRVLNYEDIDVNAIEAEAKHYCRNIIDAVYATGSNIQTRGAAEDNPIAAKLAAMDIEDDQGNPVSFYDLSDEQQKLFLERWVKMEAFELSRKMKRAPESRAAIVRQNEIVDETFREFGLTPQTRSAGKKINSKDFFAVLKDKFVSRASVSSMGEDAEYEASTNATSYDDVPAKRFQEGVKRYGEVGDLMVSLPKHGSPFHLISYSQKYQNWKVGHVGILNMRLTRSNYPGNTRFVHAATINGTEKERIDWWYNKSYVMGLYKIKYTWFGLKREYIKLPFWEMRRHVWEAERYLGRPYCKDISFAFAKLVCPYKFICTTYLWHCVKNVHGIDVSSWWNLFLITPSDIYNSSHTYVKGEII